ncbi:MAG: PIN domain-containing protein [Deltaproteobacteria bacterium]|jgi:predicted nucleic acid-binding protein|nr:PIN domain-containing protein [Deltaproteobacteria bacterium]
MKVLVDTCVWSHALRHKNPDKEQIKKLSDLIHDGRAVLIGPVKQELLSGISRSNQFEKLKDILSAFEEIQLKSIHFEKAAEFCNVCRSKGIQGSTIDFLICAVAHTEHLSIFTLDKDFQHYAKHLPIHLLK